MKFPVQRYLVPGLAVLCGISALALIPVFHLPGEHSQARESGRTVQEPGLDAFNEAVPMMQEVAARHLFIAERKATGQNAFPDLAVKGVFLGTERSAVFSLKSKPQANLRVWMGRTESALSQIVDPKDPRQPIAQFLREWNIKEIGFSGVQMVHFITGEVQTYAVDYTPEKKVKDDASRGYGQGIIPQGEGGQSVAARTAAGNNASRTAGQQASGFQANQMADRISAMVQRMTPDQKKQFLQRVQQNMTGNAGQNSGGTSKQPATQNKTPSKNGKSAQPASAQKKKTK
jgi:hypothetical protein